MSMRLAIVALVTLGSSSLAFAGNYASVSQIGVVSSSSITQVGARNSATAMQISTVANRSSITQVGPSNSATVGQAANFNHSTIVQLRGRH